MRLATSRPVYRVAVVGTGRVVSGSAKTDISSFAFHVLWQLCSTVAKKSSPPPRLTSNLSGTSTGTVGDSS